MYFQSVSVYRVYSLRRSNILTIAAYVHSECCIIVLNWISSSSQYHQYKCTHTTCTYNYYSYNFIIRFSYCDIKHSYILKFYYYYYHYYGHNNIEHFDDSLIPMLTIERLLFKYYTSQSVYIRILNVNVCFVVAYVRVFIIQFFVFLFRK